MEKSSRARPRKFHSAHGVPQDFQERQNERTGPMKKLIGVFGVIVAVLGGTGSSAHAAAWCLFYDPSTYNCGFHSYQQCLESMRGSGGYFRPNPFEGGGQSRRRRDY